MRDLFRRYPSSYGDSEIERLTRILRTWLSLEQSRAPFEIEGLEVDTEIELQGLAFSLRMDRVDRVGDSLIVIDYKTGRTRSTRLMGAPLLEPQLPVYAISTPRVAAVCFARVSEKAVALAGVAAPGLDLAPARLGKLPAGGWEEVRAAWERQLDDIVGEYKTGYAEVLPRDIDLCNTCHLASFCRVRREKDAL